MPENWRDGAAKKDTRPATWSSTEICQDLKWLAMTLNCPGDAMTHLSARLEKRKDKRPRLPDLFPPCLAQQADMVLFIHRDDYYDPVYAHLVLAELIVAKQPGPIATVYLVFNKQLVSFKISTNPANNQAQHSAQVALACAADGVWLMRRTRHLPPVRP